MKILYTYFFLLCLVSDFSIAQSTVLNGTVLDTNGEPVFAANIYFKENPSKGVISGFDGDFTFSITQDEMSYTLIISYIGFITREIPINSIENYSEITIILSEDQRMLENIVVYARDPIAEHFSVKRLEKLDIYKEPASKGDPLKAITILPASTTVNESANPSLRGSDGSRSAVFLNGVPIFEPVRYSQINGIGYFSILNPEIIDEQYVYASNPPISLGNSSAGLVQVNTLQSLPNNQVQLSSNLASSGIFVSQKLNNKAFFQLYGNNQFSDAFLDLNGSNVQELNNFGTQDAGVNVHLNLSSRWKFNLFSYAIKEDFNINTQIFTHQDQASANTLRNYSILNLEYQTGQHRWTLNSNYDIRSEEFNFGNLDSKNDRTTFYNALNYQFSYGKSSIEAGINQNYNRIQIDDLISEYFYAYAPDIPTIPLQSTLSRSSLEAYLYSTWQINESLVFTSGYRTNILYNNTRNYLSRQAALRIYLTDEQSLLISGGRYHNFNTPNSVNPNFFLQRSNQFAVDYDYETENRLIEAAFFYKLEDAEATIATVNPIEKIRNIGIELSYTQRIGSWLRFYIANTFLDQQVRFSGIRYDGELDLNYFIKSSITYDKPSFLTASLTYVGRPGTRFTSINGGEFDNNTGFYIPNFADSFNDARFNNYNNLSFSVSKYIPIDTNALVVFFSANNFFDFQNEENRWYTSNYDSFTMDLFEQRTFFFGLVWMWNR